MSKLSDAAKREPVALAAAVRVLVLATVAMVAGIAGVVISPVTLGLVTAWLAAGEAVVAVLTRQAVTPNAKITTAELVEGPDAAA